MLSPRNEFNKRKAVRLKQNLGIWLLCLATSVTGWMLPAYAEEQGQNLQKNDKTIVEKAAELDLSDLILQWASEMDLVFAETKIENKDNTKKVFNRLGVKDSAFVKYVHSIKEKDNPFANLVPGRIVQARLTPTGEVLSFKIFRPIDTKSKNIAFFEVFRENIEVPFSHQNKQSEFDSLPIAVSGVINSSLEAATREARIPASVVAQIKQQLDGVLDLKKDITKGDTFSVIYERRQLEGADLGAGKLLALEFYSKNKTVESYWFESETVEGFYDSNGANMGKTFLRFPCESRLTSTFNRVRKHPITGKLRPHWGIDLGAPKGTPVYAVSDGVISVKRYQRRGYGYWLEINHGSGYTSLYAHLSKYAPNMEVGRKVTKGQLIGYVGTTGLVTGPHLHYELKKDGAQINPLLADLGSSETLSKELMGDFKVAISPLQRQMAMLSKLHLARNDDKRDSLPQQ